MRLKLVDSQEFIKQFYYNSYKIKHDEETNTLTEQEISRREIALENHLKNEKLTQREIGKSDPNAVF